MRASKTNPDAGGVGARDSFGCVAALNGSDKTKSAIQNQVKSLPSRATLSRRWPSLRLNRYTGRWRDDAAGAKGEDLQSLLAFLEERAR